MNPKSEWEISNLIHAKIIGESDQICGDNDPYPHYIVKDRAYNLSKGPNDAIRLTGSDTLTASIGNGLSFQNYSFEIWGTQSESKEQQGSSSPDGDHSGSQLRL
jgi:hypothetical protein